MTDTAMELVARLILDSDEYDAGLDNAIGEAEKKGNGIGSGIANGIGGGLKLAGAAIAGASTAMVGFGADAVKTGEQFDKSMAQVAATMGKSVDEIENLRDFAQEMGASTSFSASQAADALNYMALAGYDANQSMEMLPNVLNLAAAGGMSLATASDMVTDAQTALGIKFEDMDEVIDQMAKTASTTNTSVSQLGDAMLTIGATARNVKGGTVELSQVLGILADNGIKASEGGTHLRNMILSLQTPSDKGAIALEKIGMSYEKMYDEAGNMRALPEIFMEMQTAMEGMDQASKDAIISGVFNKTDLAAVNALIGTNAERWNEVEAAITDSAGAAQAMANTQLDNLAGDITLAKSAFEGLQIAISDELTPGIRDFVKFGGEGLQRLTMAFKEGGLGGAMEVFGDLLSEGLTMIIDKLPAVVDAGAQLLGALGQGLIDNLPTLTSAAVQIVTMLSKDIVEALPVVAQAGFDLLNELIGGVTEAIPSLITDIADVVARIAEVLTDPKNVTGLMQAGVDVLQAIVQGILDALPVLIDALPVIYENVANSIIESLPIMIDGIISLVTAITNKLPDIIKKISQSIPKIIQSVVKALTTALPMLIQGVISLVNAIVQALPEIIQSLIAALPDIVSAVVTALVESLPLLVNGLVQLVIGLVEALPEIMQAFTDATPMMIEMIITALMDNLPILIEGIITTQMALWEHLPEILSALVDAIPKILDIAVSELLANVPILLNGIVQIFGTITTAVVNAAAGVFGKVTGALVNWWNTTKADVQNKFNQFVENFRTWLDQLPYNLGVALGNMINKFVEWKDDVINWIKTEFPKIIFNITKWFIDLPGNIKNLIDGVIEKLKNWASDMIDTVKEEVPKIIDAIASFFEELPEKAVEWGRDMVSSFASGIREKIDSAKNAASEVARGIKSMVGHSHPTEGPMADDYKWMPDMMDLFAEGILDNEDKVTNAVEKAFDLKDTVFSSSGDVSGVTGGARGLISPTVSKPVTVVLEVDKTQFGKVVFNLNQEESQRIGVDLGKAVVS